MSEFYVEMRGIEKYFGSNKVLHGVDFCLRKGSIHALLGENGTGKTTLMNILGGVFPPNAGRILWDGKPAGTRNIRAAEGYGIAFIHQELTLIDDLTVYENLFLGREIKKKGLLDKKQMIEKAGETLRKMGIELSPKTNVRSLNASYKQIVEIARALMRNARCIIMDEPTTSLTEVEIEHIFSLMRSLREQGVSFVFISHKLQEAINIADHYTVMRDGYVVADGEMSPEVTEEFLARHMVGKELSYNDVYRARQCGEVLLEAKGLSREREYQDISFTVSRGEIVGFTGLLGDGHSELFESVFGCNQPKSGEIRMRGKTVKITNTSKAKKLGISYVPRNRKDSGIIKDLSVGANMSLIILEQLRRFLFVSKGKELESNRSYVNSLHIRVHSLNDLITSLSGGNQQKAVLAKALGPKPDLIILDNPTQGVDVGAKLEIYNIIMELADQGIGFVILSSEAQEILRLCDRVYVMYHGDIRKEFSRKNVSEEAIMIVATGGTV